MASAIVPLLVGTAVRSITSRPEPTATPKPVISSATSDESLVQAEARTAAEQQAAGEKRSKQAAAFLKDRNAKGFGSNPNTAKPFLLGI